MTERADIVIVGAGAAGLMTAIWAGRTNSSRSIVLLDGARGIGAKILVAGGGRCNVTHFEVDEQSYAGSTRPAIAKVLRRFGVPETIEFFRGLGVELKREATGKLFPVTDDAHTVLDALLCEVRRVGVRLRHPCRVTGVSPIPPGAPQASLADVNTGEINMASRTVRDAGRARQERCNAAESHLASASGAQGDRFVVHGDWGSMTCRTLVLATGGNALPKSGSDGAGYAFAVALGHTLTSRITPALVPLVLAPGHFLRDLPGVSFQATLEVRSSTGARLASFTNSTLCTHFGLSGPAVLDISRYYTEARAGDPQARLVINFMPGDDEASVDRLLLAQPMHSVTRALAGRLPERLLRAIAGEAGIESGAPVSTIRRERRRNLVRGLCSLDLPVTGDRGFTHAEVTAGGVPLSELRLDTMESRRRPGLHLVGEICDVDGRIGGFNFQWAWASGYVAGRALGQ